MRRRSGFSLVVLLVPLTILYLLYRFHGRVADTASVHAKNYSKTIVVASVKAADTSWVHRELPDWEPAVYVADDPTAPLHPKVNLGREANIYLTYIIDHYDRLPDIMVFMHEHETSYHIDKAFYSNPESVNRLNLGAIERLGYQGLNCWQAFNCEVKKGQWFDYADDMLKEAWDAVYSEPMPDIVSGPLYAQFAVSRAAVHVRSKDFYERVHNWLLTTKTHEQVSGRAMEHMWHYIFGKPAVYCQLRDECLCAAFDMCDKNDPEVQRAINATRATSPSGNPPGYDEWKDERNKKGLDDSVYLWMLEVVANETQAGIQPSI